MKIYIILLSCLTRTLSITVDYETTQPIRKNPKDYKNTIHDIRLVPSNQILPRQKFQQSEVLAPPEKITLKPNSNNYKLQINAQGVKNKIVASRTSQTARIGNSQTYLQGDESHQNYLKKMADQLYIAQKHASVLSDYQKFIINQDQDVKNFVLGQTVQTRTSKPFSRSKHNGRSLSQSVGVAPVAKESGTTARSELKRIVVVTPKAQSAPEKISLLPKDHTAQPTELKYVNLAPQSLGHFVDTQVTPKVTLVPYHTPQAYGYYDLGVTAKPQLETVQVPTTLSLGLGSYVTPDYHHEVKGHAEEEHYTDPKYEFMYKVKDHEKNNHFGHMESRTDKGTYGYYFVHLPDGRLETVKYWADKTGYHAKVHYQGEAKHPPSEEYKIHSQHNHISYK